MDKRNKLWRCQQMARVFKARMILYAAYGHCVIRDTYYAVRFFVILPKADRR